MRFSLVSALATLGSVAMAQPVAQLAARAVTSQQTVAVLNDLTTKANDVTERANELNIPNTFVVFPRILTTYQDIIVTADNFIGQDQSGGQFSNEECDEISKYHHQFALVNEDALKVLTNKATLPTTQPFHQPMVATLHQLEATYDALAQTIIAYCPQATSDQPSLDDAIHLATDAYNQYV